MHSKRCYSIESGIQSDFSDGIANGMEKQTFDGYLLVDLYNVHKSHEIEITRLLKKKS